MTTYTGTPFGAINDKYVDQMGTALPGDFAFASDNVLADSIIVDEANGIPFGYGVIKAYNTTAARAGIANITVKLPVGTESATDFAGIIVRSNAGQTNADGVAMVADGRTALVAKPNRAGLRMWVKAQATIAAGDDVFWIVKDDTGHGLPVGTFTNAAITVSGETDTVALTTAKFISAGSVASGIVLMEMAI